MNALAYSYLFWIALIFVLFGLCILPSVIATIRGVQDLGWIIVINVIPTGVGWLAALIALMLPRREPPPGPRPYGAQSHAPATYWPTYQAWLDSWAHE